MKNLIEFNETHQLVLSQKIETQKIEYDKRKNKLLNLLEKNIIDLTEYNLILQKNEIANSKINDLILLFI